MRKLSKQMSIYSRVGQWRKDFCDEHGGPEVCVRVGNGDLLYFPNGARMSSEPDGDCFDPPDEEHERLQFVLMYWTEKLRRAEESHTELRKSVKATFTDDNKYECELYMGTQAEAEQELGESKQTVLELRRKVEKVTKRYEAAMGDTPARRRDDAEVERMRQSKQDRLAKRLKETQV